MREFHICRVLSLFSFVFERRRRRKLFERFGISAILNLSTFARRQICTKVSTWFIWVIWGVIFEIFLSYGWNMYVGIIWDRPVLIIIQISWIYISLVDNYWLLPFGIKIWWKLGNSSFVESIHNQFFLYFISFLRGGEGGGENFFLRDLESRKFLIHPLLHWGKFAQKLARGLLDGDNFVGFVRLVLVMWVKHVCWELR